MEWGLPGKPSGPVQQEIDVEAKTLSNRMLFGDDSVFDVSSTIEPEVGAPVLLILLQESPQMSALVEGSRCVVDSKRLPYIVTTDSLALTNV